MTATPEITFVRSTAVALAEIAVFCDPQDGGCGAGRGSFCRSRGGYQNFAVGFHAARRRLTAGWSENERFEAYRQVRVEQEQRRAETAAALAKPLTPEQVRSRQATAEAWARTALDARAGRVERDERELRLLVSPPRPVADLSVERAKRRKPLSPFRGPSGVA